MAFRPVPEKDDVYVDLQGVEHNLDDQPADFRECLAELIRYYNWNPPYPQFKMYWRDDSSPVGCYLNPNHPQYRLARLIAKDLEKRLGISQGRLAE